MPQRKAAKKELSQHGKRTARNLAAKEKMKAVIKKLKKTLAEKDTAAIKQTLNEVYQILDKAVAKKFIHHNKASRKKSRLAMLVNKSAEKKA